MDDRKFFKVLWRINAIAIFCASVLIIGKFVADEFFQNPYRSPAVNAVTYQVNEKGDVVSKEQWIYYGLRQLDGAPTLIIPLQPVTRLNYPSPDRNLLFLTSDLQGGKWLFPDNQQDITEYRELHFGDNKNTLALWYEVIERTTKKEQATPAGKPSLYLSRPDGSELTQILNGYDRRIDQLLTDENHLVVLYVRDSRVHSALITLSDFKLIEDVELPPIIE